MKKIFYVLGALALMAGMTSCGGDDDKGKIDVSKIVLDGFYVYGEATGDANAVVAKNAMAAGSNEVEKALRPGMYEKYIWLEANKDFSLIQNSAGKKTYFGAELTEVNYGYDAETETGLNFDNNPNMMIQQGVLIIGENAPKMQVKETGLYHIVLDNNEKTDLKEPQIIVQKADWGVRGGMNGWGYTKGEATTNADGSITYTFKDQELASKGEFKFASCHGWKINLDVDGVVKAEVGLGADADGKLANTGGNIAVDKAGMYDITLTYNCVAGELGKSFTYTTTLTKESTLPETMYIIGNDFGNWDWDAASVVTMTPVHSHAGHFWAIRYMTTATQFKFCAVKAWNGDFKGLDTNSGYITPDNCQVEADGVYMIYVDFENSKVIVEPANVFGMGDAFGGWDGGLDANKFAADGAVMKATTSAAGNLRIYATLSEYLAAEVSPVDWWQMEFLVADGVIAYRGAGGDQDAVAVTAGQTITLDFNGGTGTIE